jgi:hypothetical protein
VTSNPSPAYVGRVSAVFNAPGAQRGDLARVVRAVLMDPEARTPSTALGAGKLREPVQRLVQTLRAFNFRSTMDGRWLATTNDPWFMPADPPGAIGQLPMHAPSVFSYYRATFQPPNSELSRNGLIGPEFQIQNEVSAADWVNAMDTLIYAGMGQTWYTNPFEFEIRSDFAVEAALAHTPDVVLDRINLLLFDGRLSNALRADLREAMLLYPTSQTGWRKSRAQIAVLLALASPEYLVQK